MLSGPSPVTLLLKVRHDNCLANLPWPSRGPPVSKSVQSAETRFTSFAAMVCAAFLCKDHGTYTKSATCFLFKSPVLFTFEFCHLPTKFGIPFLISILALTVIHQRQYLKSLDSALSRLQRLHGTLYPARNYPVAWVVARHW